MEKTHYTVGEKVTNLRNFTSPLGTHFKAGTVFTVVIGGEAAGRSILLHADMCGSGVWISDGLFLTADGKRDEQGFVPNAYGAR